MRICKKISLSRQSYYKQLSKQAVADLKPDLRDRVVITRNQCGQIGGRKLYYLLSGELEIGRDKFFHWLREERLLVNRKRRFAKTTNSNHSYRIPPNRIERLQIDKADQVWVSDITYLRTRDGFCYLALVMDLYSRRIVGFDVNNTLELVGAQRALKMAQRQRINKVKTIHHSDRGSQYASPRYVNLLRDKGMINSMTTGGNCYQNAAAERLNGILKYEFSLNSTFESIADAKRTVLQAVYCYNNNRPHWALNMKTPNQVYQEVVT